MLQVSDFYGTLPRKIITPSAISTMVKPKRRRLTLLGFALFNLSILRLAKASASISSLKKVRLTAPSTDTQCRTPTFRMDGPTSLVPTLILI